MLTLLRISGFALIDEAEIAFGPGLTAVTGETGAGKSILVEALGLLRGARAGADLIRAGRDEARVEAILELPDGSAARGACSPTAVPTRTAWSSGGRSRAAAGDGRISAQPRHGRRLASLVGPLVDIARSTTSSR